MLFGFPIETVLVFIVLSVGALFIDLHYHKDDEPVPLKSAALWSAFWVVIALVFAGYLKWYHGSDVASKFLTGYSLEKVLSVDNLFVFIAIFTWFKVDSKYQHRVLYWGIIGAVVFRLMFVAIGTSLMSLGAWVEVVFASMIAATATMMLKSSGDDGETDYSDNFALRLVSKVMPVTDKINNHDFFTKMSSGKWAATPLFLCLVIIELSDVMFAFDSVPAIIAVSREPFIVFSAMMFAILGLRTLYFVLEALKNNLVYLEAAVIFLLYFVAGKLATNASAHILGHGVTISATQSLYVVLVTLVISIIASLLKASKK